MSLASSAATLINVACIVTSHCSGPGWAVSWVCVCFHMLCSWQLSSYMTFDLHIWLAGSPWHYLGRLWRSEVKFSVMGGKMLLSGWYGITKYLHEYLSGKRDFGLVQFYSFIHNFNMYQLKYSVIDWFLSEMSKIAHHLSWILERWLFTAVAVPRKVIIDKLKTFSLDMTEHCHSVGGFKHKILFLVVKSHCHGGRCCFGCCICVIANIFQFIICSALTLLVEQQEGHLACQNWVVGCWLGYLSGVRRRFAYARLMPLPLTVSCSSKSRLVLPSWFYLSGTGSPG